MDLNRLGETWVAKRRVCTRQVLGKLEALEREVLDTGKIGKKLYDSRRWYRAGRWTGLCCLVNLLPSSINSFELKAASVQLLWHSVLLDEEQHRVHWRLTMSLLSLLCFSYVWHSSHTIIQWKQIEEMQLHLKSNKSEDTCNNIVIYYYWEAIRFLGLIYLMLPNYHSTPTASLDSMVKKPQPAV